MAEATTTTSRSKRAAWGLVAVGLVGLLALGYLRGESRPSERAPSGVVRAPEPAVPQQLLALGFVDRPERAWRAVRGLAPFSRSAALSLIQALKMPLSAAPLVDDAAPMGVAFLAGETVSVVMAVHLRGGSGFLADLSTGSEARYATRLDPPTKVVLLRPKESGVDLRYEAGVLGNYLVIAQSEKLITQTAPYLVSQARLRLARTAGAPDKGSDQDFFELSAQGPSLHRGLQPLIVRTWQLYRKVLLEAEQTQQNLHGRPADFADPKAVMSSIDDAVEWVVRLMAGIDYAELKVGASRLGLRASVKLAASHVGELTRATEEMAQGSLSQLLSVPASVSLAAVVHSTPKSRQAWAANLAKGLSGVFGSRLSASQQTKVTEAFFEFARGRGNQLLLTLGESGRKPLALRGPVDDADAAARGIRKLVHLLEVPAIVAPLEAVLGPLNLSFRDAPGVRGGWARLASRDVSVDWQVEQDAFTVSVVSEDPDPKDGAEKQSVPPDLLSAMPALADTLNSYADAHAAVVAFMDAAFADARPERAKRQPVVMVLSAPKAAAPNPHQPAAELRLDVIVPLGALGRL